MTKTKETTEPPSTATAKVVDLRKEEVNILPVTIHFKNLKFDFLILSLIFLEWCFSVISVVPVTAVFSQ